MKRRLWAEPQKLSYQDNYFYVDNAVEIAIAVNEVIPPTAAIVGICFGIAKTKTIHNKAIPKATHTE